MRALLTDSFKQIYRCNTLTTKMQQPFLQNVASGFKNRSGGAADLLVQTDGDWDSLKVTATCCRDRVGIRGAREDSETRPPMWTAERSTG